MKLIILIVFVLYIGALVYLYVTQDSKVFNTAGIEKKEPIHLSGVKHIKFEVEKNIILDGVYKKTSKDNAPLIIYFGGNSDDATRIVLHIKKLSKFDVVAFNYRGFVKSEGKPSEKNLFSDALKIFDKYKKNKKVIIIGRSLGTGVATYVASKRETEGLILITPYDSIASIGQKMYPYFPIQLLSKHKFESVKYIQSVKARVGLIEVKNDTKIPKYHFNKLKNVVPNLAFHINLENTTHADVLNHRDFEQIIKNMIELFIKE